MREFDAIEGIATINTCIRQLVKKKTTPENRIDIEYYNEIICFILPGGLLYV